MLASGAGGTMRALLEAGIEVRQVICDRDAPAISVAHEHGVPVAQIEPSAFEGKLEYELALLQLIEACEAQLVVLAGYMRVLGSLLVRKYHGRMVNIHPSLLPDLKGIDTHRRALEAGNEVHGCTVHWVTEELDAGPVIAQSKVPVKPADSVAELERRVKAAERSLYPKVIADILAGKVASL